MVKEFNYSGYYDEMMTPEKFKDDLSQMIEDLKDTVSNTERLYVCANEIGYKSKAFCLIVNNEPCVIFNPMFKIMEDSQIIEEHDYETDKDYIIPRCTKVGVFYQNEKKEIFYNDFEGLMAVIFSRAVDCLNGLHDKDYGLEIDDDFKNASDEEKSEVIAQYCKELQELNAKIDTELSEDDESKEAWKTYQFNRAFARGEIEIEQQEEKPNRKMRRFLAREARLALKRAKNESKNN